MCIIVMKIILKNHNGHKFSLHKIFSIFDFGVKYKPGHVLERFKGW